MSTWQYRLTLIGCVASWLLLGLHLPALHQMTHHGRALPPTVIGFMVIFALLGIVGLCALLRPSWSRPAPSNPSARE
jgi:hypothetical protein